MKDISGSAEHFTGQLHTGVPRSLGDFRAASFRARSRTHRFRISGLRARITSATRSEMQRIDLARRPAPCVFKTRTVDRGPPRVFRQARTRDSAHSRSQSRGALHADRRTSARTAQPSPRLVTTDARVRSRDPSSCGNNGEFPQLDPPRQAAFIKNSTHQRDRQHRSSPIQTPVTGIRNFDCPIDAHSTDVRRDREQRTVCTIAVLPKPIPMGRSSILLRIRALGRKNRSASTRLWGGAASVKGRALPRSTFVHTGQLTQFADRILRFHHRSRLSRVSMSPGRFSAPTVSVRVSTHQTWALPSARKHVVNSPGSGPEVSR